MELLLKQIAHIENNYKEKFGIPRQSGLTSDVSRIVLEGEYARPEAVRELKDYDYIWLIFGFSKNHDRSFAATVKPPRLDGKTRIGVFATRSPYRPNAIGLSSVKIVDVDPGRGPEEPPVITVAGADLLDGTPIYDIKPYLPFTDSHPNAKAGFTEEKEWKELTVAFACDFSMLKSTEKVHIEELLKQDPRASYDRDTERDYKLRYGKYDIGFCVEGDQLTVLSIVEKY